MGKVWMITFPLVSPLILTNAVFIIVYFSPIMKGYCSLRQCVSRGGYGVSAAMAIIYLLRLPLFWQ